MNEQLYNKHLECAATWPRLWSSIQQIIDSNLQGEMDKHYENLNKKLDKLQKRHPQHTKQATHGHQQGLYPRIVDLTNIKFTKREQELLDKGMQFNLKQAGKNNWNNLIVETEQAIRHLEVKMQDAYRILAAKKLKQLQYTLNNRNTTQKRLTVPAKNIHNKIKQNNAMITQADKEKP